VVEKGRAQQHAHGQLADDGGHAQALGQAAEKDGETEEQAQLQYEDQ
jgi:hypothetical protein